MTEQHNNILSHSLKAEKKNEKVKVKFKIQGEGSEAGKVGLCVKKINTSVERVT